MSDETSRLEELARAEYEKFTQETNSSTPFYQPEEAKAPPSKGKKRRQVALLVFLILLDVVLLVVTTNARAAEAVYSLSSSL